MRFRLTIVLFTALAVLSACSLPVDQGSRSAHQSSEAPASTLPARWWLWAESAGSRNPISDSTGKDCAVNQPADVWFLAGTFGGSATRSCTIPANRQIYFPVMNSMHEVVEGDEVERVLEECYPDPLEMSAYLDGKELDIHRATSEGSFDFQAGSASMIASPNVRFEAVACGEWVGPLSLPPGEHLLEFGARSNDFELTVTYDLTVK